MQEKEKEKEEIVNILKSMSGKCSVREIFSDWVTCMAISIQNAVTINDARKNKEAYNLWLQREQLYLRTIGKYNAEEVKIIWSRMFVLLNKALMDNPKDILGEIYITLGLGSKRREQYFTPLSVAILMAKLTIPENIQDMDEYSLYEPTCGSGTMIIATASVLQQSELNYQKMMRVVAQDLDWTAVYMTYVQLSLLGINAIVIQGDTLKNPYVPSDKPSSNIFMTPVCRWASNIEI